MKDHSPIDTEVRREERVKPWTYKIQYGPDGEEYYAWVYHDKQMVGTMRTHLAKAICAGMNAAAPTPQTEGGE